MRLLVILLVLAGCEPAWRSEVRAWTVDKPLPPFPLVDQYGNAVSLDTGLIAFAFSRCAVPTACPQTIERVKELEDEVRTVVVTLDPAHDTPEVLKAWAARVGTRSTVFATGDAEVIEALSSCFNVFVTQDMSHPVKAALLESGRVVTTWKDNRIDLGAQGTGHRAQGTGL